MEKIQIFDYRRNQTISVEKIGTTKAEWKKLLTPKQYEVTTEKGTEQPFTCTFDEIKEPGVFSWSAAARIYSPIVLNFTPARAGPVIMSRSLP